VIDTDTDVASTNGGGPDYTKFGIIKIAGKTYTASRYNTNLWITGSVELPGAQTRHLMFVNTDDTAAPSPSRHKLYFQNPDDTAAAATGNLLENNDATQELGKVLMYDFDTDLNFTIGWTTALSYGMTTPLISISQYGTNLKLTDTRNGQDL